MSELRFDNVTVRYGSTTAVDDVSLTVPSGQVLGLVGESGSGKSTLARAAVGLAPVDSGTILLNGKPVPVRGRRRPLQMVFQDPYSSLDPRMSIGESVAEAIPPGMSRAERRAEVERLLGLVHLDPDRVAMRPAALSGGQRQRVALARALAGKPEVIVADEITSALDVSVQGTVLNLVRELQRELGLSMLFISHNLAVVRYVSDVIAVMYLGRIVEVGPADRVLSDPQHPYTRDLLASAPSLAAATHLDPATPDDVPPGLDTEPADPHHPPAGCRYHPRCPIGPLALPERAVCIDVDPDEGATSRPHRAACHFPGRAGIPDQPAFGGADAGNRGPA